MNIANCEYKFEVFLKMSKCQMIRSNITYIALVLLCFLLFIYYFQTKDLYGEISKIPQYESKEQEQVIIHIPEKIEDDQMKLWKIYFNSEESIQVGIILTELPITLDSLLVKWIINQFGSLANQEVKLTIHIPSGETELAHNLTEQIYYDIQYHNCSLSTIPSMNCMADNIFQLNTEFLLLVDINELVEDSTLWALESIISVANRDSDSSIWIESIRSLRVAGRGVQFRSELNNDADYMQERYSPKLSDIWLEMIQHEMDDGVDVYKQLKPMFLFTPSICLHVSHYESLGYLFDSNINNLEDGLLWISYSYKYIQSSVIAMPPNYYKESNFPWDGNANYSLTSNLQSIVYETSLKFLEYKVNHLLAKYNILSCDTIDNIVNRTSYDPISGDHSTKQFLSKGYLDNTFTQKLFIYRIAVGGLETKTLATLQNLHNMLLLINSPFIPKLIAYCPKNFEYAISFVESSGDLKSGIKNMTCLQRIDVCQKLVNTIEAIHSIGIIQCDWKQSQWIFEKETGILKIVDLDDAPLIPNDCGQASLDRNTAVGNFHRVNDGAKGWPTNYTEEVLDTMFLRDYSRGGYASLDERFDIYKLGTAKYFYGILEYHGACADYYSIVKPLIIDLSAVYPPTLKEIKNRLLEIKEKIENE